MKKLPAHLILADGTQFSGTSFGYSKKESTGEVVFNTSLVGYQEILTDPSYFRQMVVMTYPQIGNYGLNSLDVESAKPFLSALIIKENSPIVSNYRSEISLSQYLKKNKIAGLEGIDTRALVLHLRDQGAMQGVIAFGNLSQAQIKKLKEKAKNLPHMDGLNLASAVSTKKPYLWKKGVEGFDLTEPKIEKPSGKKYKIIAYDYGIKQNILRLLIDHGCEVKVVPCTYPAEKTLAEKPDGIFLSNGPGDPAACVQEIEIIKKLLGKKPIFGICLGHQLLALALGAKTFKLKFGHHGGNQPVMDLKTKKVEITSQNHGFAVDDKKLPGGVEVTHVNLNDKTVEGVSHKKLKAFSVQYHPEASPGPSDSHYLFQRFIDLIKNG